MKLLHKILCFFGFCQYELKNKFILNGDDTQYYYEEIQILECKWCKELKMPIGFKQ